MNTPILWIVSTPLGNLGDISQRAVSVLRDVQLIAAEDTRTTRRLLAALGIEKKEVISYHDHIERQRASQIIARMQREQLSVALVSDAGTPCISDPGYHLVQAAHAAKIRVSPVPGPSSLAALVSVSGLPSNRLMFVGFLPAKKSQRIAEFQKWQDYEASIVFFESLRRLERSLAELAELYPLAQVTIGRELTKVFEEVISQPILEALSWSKLDDSKRGEGVVMVDLSQCESRSSVDPVELQSKIFQQAQLGFADGMSLRDLLRELRDCGLSRAELYELLLRAKNQKSID